MLKLLGLCLAQTAYSDILVKVALCSSTRRDLNNYAPESWTGNTADASLKISFDTIDPEVRFTRAGFVFELDEINTRWNVQMKPWKLQSQLLRDVNLDDVETVEVTFGAEDILCLESMEISTPNCRGKHCQKFKILQNYDNHNYDPSDMPSSVPNNWVSKTGKKITFWTGNCVSDARPLSMTTPFQTACHDTNTFTIVARDECLDGSHNCVENAVCKNTRTSYKCECKKYYEGYPYIADASFTEVGEPCALVPVDECKLGTHDCGANSHCVDKDEGFDCVCNNGYAMKGGSCKDINECKHANKNDCHSTLGICTNTVGSYTCDCVAGYQGDGITCKDIDECAGHPEDSPCGANEDCINTIGDFDCVCSKGYRYKSGHCVDIDECKTMATPCGVAPNKPGHKDSICTNTDGDYTCRCPGGAPVYRGDADNGGCKQINECLNDSDNICVEHSTCENHNNGYECPCNKNFVGDGKEECFPDDTPGLCKQPDIEYGDWLVPWPEIPGCQYPTCDAHMTVVDAWKRSTNSKKNPYSWGWSIVISSPKAHYDNDGFSVLVRLPTEIQKGSFQVWNAKFHNFYEDDKGYFVLIHSKKTTEHDLHDQYSFNLVAERTSTFALPGLLFWDNRQKNHACFQPSMHSGGQRTMNPTLEEYIKNEQRTIMPDGVRKIVISNGKIVRAY
jgi:hypothetical protein